MRKSIQLNILFLTFFESHNFFLNQFLNLKNNSFHKKMLKAKIQKKHKKLIKSEHEPEKNQTCRI